MVNCSKSRSLRGFGGCLGRLLSAIGGCGAVLLEIAIDLAPLKGVVVALVGCWRLQCCLVVNCSRSCPVRGSGGCVGWMLAAAALSCPVRGSGGCVGWMLVAAALSYFKLQ